MGTVYVWLLTTVQQQYAERSLTGPVKRTWALLKIPEDCIHHFAKRNIAILALV